MHPGSIPPPNELASLYRFVKILWFVLLVSVGLYWPVLGMLDLPPERSLDPVVQKALAALAAATGVAVLFLRFNVIPRLLARVAAGTDPTTSLATLRTFYIVCFTLAESIALYGLVVYFLGAPRDDATWFFIAAFALLALCYPKSPETPLGT